MNDFTIMLPVHRSNLALANDCIQNLLDTSDLPIICIDDFGNDNEYIKNNRLSFIHNTYSERQPLVKIWNQCIKECPTNNVIIASWRQRPSVDTFKTIYDKTNEGYGLITFDGLHFFCINKYLTTIIGFFDEGFTKGQFEDTDWFNRLRVNNIGIYMGDIAENRIIGSMWLDGAAENKKYYISKWTEDTGNNRLIQHKNEVNICDRSLFYSLSSITYKRWPESVLAHNLTEYFSVFRGFIKDI